MYVRVVVLAVAVLLSVALATPSAAVPVTWNLQSPNGTCIGADCSGSDGTDGNTRIFTASGGEVLEARAFTTDTSSSTGSFVSAYLGQYSSGLGVTNPAENGTSPSHTVDNDGRKDLVVFKFAQDTWVPLSVFLSAFGDTDIVAFVGGGPGDPIDDFSDFIGKSYSTLTASGMTQYTSTGAQLTGGSTSRTANLNLDPPGPGGPANLSGMFLVIGANNNQGDDKFKIKTLVGEKPAQVPEPATLMLLGWGFIGLGMMARRRFRR